MVDSGGFDETVTEENGPKLLDFAKHVIRFYDKPYFNFAENVGLQKKLALWLRDTYPQCMVDPYAPLADTKLIIGKTLHVPGKKEVYKKIGKEYSLEVFTGEGEIRIAPPLLANACWLDSEGNELPEHYYIEERTLCLSVKSKNDAQIAFSVYRQKANEMYERIAQNLRAERQEGTHTYTAKWLYRREREHGRQPSVNLYFRAYKNDVTETESEIMPFMDGIVAIKTERDIAEALRRAGGKFFDFDDDSREYGGDQYWYTQKPLFEEPNNTFYMTWDNKEGDAMNEAGCGSIAATNVLYYYAQQFDEISTQISGALQDAAVIPTRLQYIRTAFHIYKDYVKPTFRIPSAMLHTAAGIIPSLQEKIPKYLGIWYIDPLCDGVVSFARKSGITLKKHTLTNQILNFNNSFAKAADFIIEGLKNNYPVVLLVTFNTAIAEGHKNDNRDMVQRHIVAITAIERTAGDDEDYALVISHWGQRRIIPSLKKMWGGTPSWFAGLQATIAQAAVASTAVAAAKIAKDKKVDFDDGAVVASAVAAGVTAGTAFTANGFASISLGYCSLA